MSAMEDIRAFEKARRDYQSSQPRLVLEKRFLTGRIDKVCRELDEHVGDDIQSALNSARKQLRTMSNPFPDEEPLKRYLMEMQILGAPKTKADVLAILKSAVHVGDDIGALQFWAKHARTLFQRVEGEASESEFMQTLGLLNDRLNLIRNPKQREAHERLMQLEEHLSEFESAAEK